MSTIVDLLDAVYRVRQGENRAAALEIIDRASNTGELLKQGDFISISYTIFKRGIRHTITMSPPPSEPVEGHIDVDIPVATSIRDDPIVDPIDNRKYNFLFIIPVIDENGEDITPFTESGATYDMVIRFIPSQGGNRYAMQRTIRIECE